MKYKFTGKTKTIGGLTLNQIVCVTAFANLSTGDIGGWIESEKNLSQEGNSWVFGNARVFGYAEVSGNALVSDNAKCTKKAFTISTCYHHVTITDTHISIGCQNHPIAVWKNAGFDEVKEMDGEESAKTWVKYKDFILALEAERNE